MFTRLSKLIKFHNKLTKINKMHLLWLEKWFLVNFDVWYHDFNPLNQGLKSQYHKLWVEYFIINPKTPYNYCLTIICYFRCCRLTISQIKGCQNISKWPKLSPQRRVNHDIANCEHIIWLETLKLPIMLVYLVI